MNIHSVMPETATSARGAKRDRRQAILDAALALFADKGFDGTAVPEVAKRAEVGAGTVYRYFESKEAIVNALYRHYKQALTSRILAGIEPDQPAREQFRVYWQGMASFAREEPEAFRFLELHHHSPYLDEESRALEQSVVAIAHQTFDHFRSQQVVKDVPPAILMAIVHGAFVGMIKAKDGGYLELSAETIDCAEECVWEAIRR